jgi:chromate transporter
MNIKKNLELYSVFFSIGLVAFGGGLAMLPLLNKAVVEQKK